VRVDLDTAATPVGDGVEPVCDAVGVDPWRVTSCGTLLTAVDADDAAAVVDALQERGTPAAVAGRVREGSGLYVDGEATDPPEVDESWAAFRRLSE